MKIDCISKEKQGDAEKVFYLSDFDPNKVLSLVSFSK